jgi:DNA-binding transcriptional ArsR family regulator
MAIHPDTHERITKLQKDVEDIKEELEDQWHERRSNYEDRVRKALESDKNAAILYLEIDGVRSITEIEKSLANRGNRIPTMSLWRASMRLLKNGLIKKVRVKGKSPIYAKKPWAKALDLDGYVKTKVLGQEKSSN